LAGEHDSQGTEGPYRLTETL